MPEKSLYGVRLATWSTNEGKGTGLSHFVENRLFGGNIGHAALAITIPVTPENTALIEQYCLDPVIPYQKQKVQTHKAELDENGQYQQTDEVIAEDEVYVINFSWWPGAEEGKKYQLSKSLNEDGESERAGVDVTWNPKFADQFDIEQRIARGSKSSRLMTLGLLNIAHERNLNDQQKEVLRLGTEIDLKEAKVESLEVLQKKLGEYIQALEKLEQIEQEILPNRQALMQQHKENAALLKRVKDLINKNEFSPVQFTPAQRTFLEEKLQTNLDEVDVNNQAQTSTILAALGEAYQKEKEDFKTAKQYTAQHLEAEKRKALEPSQTMTLVLDRLMPDWKEYLENGQLNCEHARQLNRQVSLELKKENDANDKLEKQFNEIQDQLLGNPKIKVKELKEALEEKEREIREVKLQLYDYPDSLPLHRRRLELEDERSALHAELKEIKSSDRYRFFRSKTNMNQIGRQS